MRTKTCFAGALLLSAAQCLAWTEPNESREAMTEARAWVRSKLSQHAETGNHRLLLEARDIASSMNPRHSRDTLSPIDEECLRLQLEVLLAVQNARDLHYDPDAPENLVTLNVAPPDDVGQGVAAGMDPAAIKDPVARKKYEDAIAENNRRNMKLRRELYLSRAVDRAVIAIWQFVRQLPEKSEARARANEVIRSTVTDPVLLGRLASDESPGLTW